MAAATGFLSKPGKGLHRHRERPELDSLHRATSGLQGAAPNGLVDKPCVSTRVDWGNEETVPFASLHVPKDRTPWPFPGELPLGRTDPAIPTTSAGQKIERQERW